LNPPSKADIVIPGAASTVMSLKKLAQNLTMDLAMYQYGKLIRELSRRFLLHRARGDAC
jgi:hypothetical protein